MREFDHRFQFLVGDGTSNVIDRFVPLVVEGLESLNDLWTGLYGEFEGLDCFDVMTGLRDGAMS